MSGEHLQPGHIGYANIHSSIVNDINEGMRQYKYILYWEKCYEMYHHVLSRKTAETVLHALTWITMYRYVVPFIR